eukprot:Amastigsp_a340163_16.p3 type:complete len:153 gc:universal Amastigsp_a340163_16:706-248(-)
MAQVPSPSPLSSPSSSPSPRSSPSASPSASSSASPSGSSSHSPSPSHGWSGAASSKGTSAICLFGRREWRTNQAVGVRSTSSAVTRGADDDSPFALAAATASIITWRVTSRRNSSNASAPFSFKIRWLVAPGSTRPSSSALSFACRKFSICF